MRRKWTFQLGANISGKFFGVAVTGAIGLAIDGFGHVAGYAEGGGGASTSPDASVGLVVHSSNGTTIEDLSGGFTNVNVGGGWGPHATVDAFFGGGHDGKLVEGGGLTIGAGAGAGAASSATMTDTKVSKPFINPNSGCQ
ncbi:MAG: hypothetical protein ABUS47_13900 [Steroidobacter sp.]